MLACFSSPTNNAVPIVFVTIEQFPVWLEQQSLMTKTWLQQQRFSAKPDSFCAIPNSLGSIEKVVVGQRKPNDVFIAGCLATNLPQGVYQLEQWHPLAALAWGMGAYQFTRYKMPTKTINALVIPNEHDHQELSAQLNAIYLVRDLINTPTEDMDPEQLGLAAENLAKKFNAHCQQIIGDDLLAHRYPAIHTVGRASTRAPRLIDLQWGEKDAPKITLVGKGVCFDSGGLDLKSASGMALMKKDMAGGAHVLGLASMIMQMRLPVRLRVLIPAVENVISGNAYRPGDIIRSRKGLTIEIGNTDAEGRVVLADALTEAASENPALIIDMASLTGAARVALGTDLPALFTNDQQLATELMNIGNQIQDPVWQMPLYTPYRKLLDTPFADINNSSTSPYAGAITAALFLKEFIQDTITWAHFDMMAWNVCTTPGHPEGGEAAAIRTIYTYIKKRFEKNA
jgi:leucyl aminopeptidase